MPRPFSGKVHVSQSRITRKSGITYVYERTTQYDQQKGKTVTTSSKLLGKILPGSTEMIATRPRKAAGLMRQEHYALRRHVGLTDILEWAGRTSMIDRDVRSCFSIGDANKILSIARYWLGTDGNTLPRLESWQIMHDLPYQHGISEDVYGELFKSLGHNEDGIQRYFLARAQRLSTKPVIAYDSTTISTYSQNQKEARRGFNKERDGLDTIKLLTLYSVKDQEPIAFAKQPGNVPDVIALENAIEQLKCFSLEKPLVTTDTGYYSESNIREMCRRNMKFLTLIDTDQTSARSAVDALRKELESMGAVCPFDYNVAGATMSVMHEFSYMRQRARGAAAAGDTETFTRRLYLYAFKSSDLFGKHEASFRQKLMELKKQLEDGVTEFTEAARKRIETYFVCSRMGRGGKLHVTFNEKNCAKAREYFGYFVLVSNSPLEVFEALENYRLREKIEELFQDEKGSVDGRRPRIWYPDSLRGRMFVQFVALCYRCFIARKIKAVKEQLCLPREGLTQKQMDLEKNLKSWLEQRSMAQIFDWFDCIETTSVKTEVGMRRWTTESVARDRLFLALLGVNQ
jgi:hypothetical protein